MEKNKKSLAGIVLILLSVSISFFDPNWPGAWYWAPSVTQGILLLAAIIIIYLGYKEKKQGIV